MTQGGKPSGRESSPGSVQQGPLASARFVPHQSLPSLNESIRNGQAAKEKLEDPLFNMVFRSLLMEYMQQSAQTDPQESRKRDYLHTKITVLTEVLQELQTVRLEGLEGEAALEKAIERERQEASSDAAEAAGAAEINEHAGFGLTGLGQ